jgi:hypothetical protein
MRDNVVPVGTRPSSVLRDTPQDNPPMESVLAKFIPIFGRRNFQLPNLPDLALGCPEVQWDVKSVLAKFIPIFGLQNFQLPNLPDLALGCPEVQWVDQDNCMTFRSNRAIVPSCSYSTANPSEYLVKSANDVRDIKLFVPIKMKNRIGPRGWYGAHEHERR